MFGAQRLSEAELLAVILGGGHAAARAQRLLGDFGGLLGLRGADAQELCRTHGVGHASAAALAAAFELGRRAAGLELPYATPLRRPEDVTAYLRATLGPETQEVFMVLGLDARQRVRFVRRVARGSLAQVDVHPREVFRPLVRAGMHAAVLVHNHPSGDAEPSQADVELTQRLVEVGRLVGIPVLDHLVVTCTDSVSLATVGLMP